MNNPESKNNPKLEINQISFVKQALRIRLRDYTLVSKIKNKNLQILQRKLSISENQSNASFKLINQSITGIRSSSQAIEEKLDRRKKNWLSPTIPTGIVVGCSGAQCDNPVLSHTTNRVQCDVVAMICTSRVRRQRIVMVCLYSTMRRSLKLKENGKKNKNSH
jgi:hypothetical protein